MVLLLLLLLIEYLKNTTDFKPSVWKMIKEKKLLWVCQAMGYGVWAIEILNISAEIFKIQPYFTGLGKMQQKVFFVFFVGFPVMWFLFLKINRKKL